MTTITLLPKRSLMSIIPTVAADTAATLLRAVRTAMACTACQPFVRPVQHKLGVMVVIELP